MIINLSTKWEIGHIFLKVSIKDFKLFASWWDSGGSGTLGEKKDNLKDWLFICCYKRARNTADFLKVVL